jgi:NADPH:quinone reductase-like Zn-dependent oxidoreductase
MKALTYHGSKDVRVETVADPVIVNADDIILRVTATAICGSDLHIYRGKIPMMETGDILGHEFMGVVEDVGAAASAGRSTLRSSSRTDSRSTMQRVGIGFQRQGRGVPQSGVDAGHLTTKPRCRMPIGNQPPAPPFFEAARFGARVLFDDVPIPTAAS